MSGFKEGRRRNKLAKAVYEYERELLLKALEQFNGQGRAVAEYFSMSSHTLYDRLEGHGINLTEWRKRWRAGVRVINGKLLVPVGEKRRKYITWQKKNSFNNSMIAAL